MPKLTTQTVNAYLAVLLITIFGSVAVFTIIRVSDQTSFLTYDTEQALTAEF